MQNSYLKKITGAALIAGMQSFFALTVSAQTVSDDTFIALAQAAKNNDSARAETLAAKLQDYPIPSYIDYYRIRARMPAFSDAEALQFIEKYKGDAIADRMRNDWLLVLGTKRNWSEFDVQYPQFALDDDTEVKCYALMSRAAKNENVLEAAKNLLTQPREYKQGCVDLIVDLHTRRQFAMSDVWHQARLSVEANQLGTAQKILQSLANPPSDAAWAQAMNKSALTLNQLNLRNSTERELWLLALARVARSYPQQAADALEAKRGALSKQDAAFAYSQIALWAAQNGMKEAHAWYGHTAGAILSPEGWAWLVRAALRAAPAPDWTRVVDAVNAMPSALQSEVGWRYWRARGQFEQGHEEAKTALATIAKEFNFYGLMAAEDLGIAAAVPAAASSATSEELAAVRHLPGFSRAQKLYSIDMRFEGNREWNWHLRGMTDRQLLAAAQYAIEVGMLDRTVNTSDKTQGEHIFAYRYPTPHLAELRSKANQLNLDVPWVYGLIRQESRFVVRARSHVGATGLMQVMPATGRFVAKKIGMNDFTPDQLNNLSTNLTIGSNYLAMVLNDMDGSQALASAAYNAGPSRPRTWRSRLSVAVEGAIFAENIPFAETRNYVKNVLANATFYALQIEGKATSLKKRLGIVAPRSFETTALP